MKPRSTTPAQAVLDNLGLGHLKNVTKATIYLSPGLLPRVEFETVLPGPLPDITHHLYTTELTLRPPKPAAFDLDAMCAAAMGRIQAAIDDMAADARYTTARSFVAARWACVVPIRTHHIEAMGPLRGKWLECQPISDAESEWIPVGPIEEGAAA